MLLSLVLAAVAAAAPPSDWPRAGWEEFHFIGWNRGCAVAFSHLRFPALGEGTQQEPSWTRIGTVSLDAETGKPMERWIKDPSGLALTKAQLAATEARLVRDGYTEAGYIETIRPVPTAPDAGLAEAILSTASLHAEHPVSWPKAPFALSEVRYSPLGSCALAVFHRAGDPPDLYRFALAPVPVDARRERARAHVRNARALYRRQQDVNGGLEEAQIAARMDPRFAEARYVDAQLLAVNGRSEEAVAELAEAVRLDGRYARTAESAVEFEDLKSLDSFRSALAAR